MNPPTRVLGAGLDGLTAAALLARRGRRVVVHDSAPAAGGLSAPFEFEPGFVAAGPLDPEVRIAPALERELDLALPREPARAPLWLAQPDGPGLLLGSDPAATSPALAAADARALASWRAFTARVAPAIHRLMDSPPPPAFDGGPVLALARAALSMRKLGKRDLTELLRALPMAARDFLEDTFADPRLRTLLAANLQPGLHTGPRAPGTAGLLLLHEACAAPAPLGGARALVEALVRELRQRGGELHPGCGARRLRVEGGAVRAVELEDGRELECDEVVWAGAPAELLGRIPPTEIPAALRRDLEVWRSRPSAAWLLLALDAPPAWRDRPGEDPARVLVADDLDDLERAADAVKYRRGSERPVLDVRATRTAAGGAVLSVLAHHAPLDEAQLGSFAERAVARLEELSPGLEARTRARAVLGPEALRARFGAAHLHQGDLGLERLLWLRPGPSLSGGSTPIAGLALAGRGVHPGPHTLCGSGIQAARALLARR